MKQNPIFKKETVSKFFLFVGSLSDISKIDFTSLNITCYQIDSAEFKALCKTMTYKDWGNVIAEHLNEITKDFWDKERIYVLLPINFPKEFVENNFYLCYEVLLLLFPSDLSIKWIIEFQLFDDKYLYPTISSEYDFFPSGIDNSFENFLFYEEKNLNEINEFIRLYANRVNAIKYLKTAKDAYISSFHERNPIMTFLSLCISLESIVNGNTELNYRIKRNVSILTANIKSRAEVIYDNLNKIYGLRSKIVHGSVYNIEKVIEYLPYLQSLTSRVILEIALLNIINIDDLNRKLTFAGFGDKKSLSSDYKKMNLNITSYVKTFYKRLK